MQKNAHEEVTLELISKFRDAKLDVTIPPPIFIMMNGEIIHYDKSLGYLEVLFPVAKEYLNPFGTMQGGMIAAAIDNTFGPLSMLVGPLNYTRQLEIKYRKSIQHTIKKILVVAKYEKRNKRQLFFSATVMDLERNELASATAIHWIVGK